MIDYGVSPGVRRKLREKSPPVTLDEVDEVLTDPDLLEKRINRDRKRGEFTMKFVGYTKSGRLLQVYIIFKPDGAWLRSAYDGGRTEKKLYNRS